MKWIILFIACREKAVYIYRMKRKRIGLIIVVVIVAILIIGQFFQPALNNGSASGPQDITQAMNVPADVQQILEKSCYDCHSNHTIYPWFDKIFPVNWWVKNHIDEGKKQLNFTVFNTYTDRKKNKKLEEVGEQVEKGEMPLSSYAFLHPETKLTDAQRKVLIDWSKSVSTGSDSTQIIK